MFKSKSFYIVMVAVGVLMFAVTMLSSLMFGLPKIAAGICTGIATVMLSIYLPKLLMKYAEISQPEMVKKNEIEFNDERNTMIRNKAKAKVSDIIQCVFMGVFYVAILLEAPLWVFFTLVGIYLLKQILEFFFTIKYQKEL